MSSLTYIPGRRSATATVSPEKMLPRVFLMIDSLKVGGSERQFLLLSRALDRNAFDVLWGCLSRDGAFQKEAGEIREFPLGGSFFSRSAHRARKALRVHLSENAVAVAHSFDFYTNLVLIPVARLAGVPVVIGSQRQLGDLLDPIKNCVQTEVFRLCDRVVCNSRAAAARLSDAGLPESKLVVIPNGLPEEAFADAAPALPHAPDRIRIGMIARMNCTVKNHSAFLRAAARLAPQFPSAEFVLVGDGSLRPGLEQMARQLGLARRVRFLGTRHDIAAVLASLNISVVPSLSEGLSNVILESMAAGRAIVATRVGGTPELIRDAETGLLVLPGDDRGLAAALEALVRDSELRVRLGVRAQEFARSHFRLELVQAQFERLYTDLMAEKGCRRETGKVVLSERAKPKRALRVAIVAPSLRGLGGQAVQAELLWRHWKDDSTMETLFIPTDPNLPSFLAWTERIPYLRTVVRMPFYLTGLWRGLSQVDLAHIFSASYWSFLIAPVPALLVARCCGTKAVLNYRSGEARDHLRNWRTALFFLRKADALVVPSSYLAEVFRGFGLAAHIIPSLVDFERFHPAEARELAPRLLCTRNFEPYYGVDVVIRAFAQVKQQVSEATLCLVGSGSLERELRALVRKLGVRDVQFAGSVGRDAIADYYRKASVLVNGSRLDNMPNAILEGFAAGLPVVSTAPEGMSYLVQHGETGLLSPVDDVPALAANLLLVLGDQALAKRLSQNALGLMDRYRWPAVRQQWLETFFPLVGRKAPSVLARPASDAEEQVVTGGRQIL